MTQQPSNLTRQLAELNRLTVALAAHATRQQDTATDRGDDTSEDAWLWTAVTGHRLSEHLDLLEQHLTKLGVGTDTRRTGRKKTLNPRQQRVSASARDKLADPDAVAEHQAIDPEWQRIRALLTDAHTETSDPMLRYVAGLCLRFWASSAGYTIDDACDRLYVLMVSWQADIDNAQIDNPDQNLK